MPEFDVYLSLEQSASVRVTAGDEDEARGLVKDQLRRKEIEMSTLEWDSVGDVQVEDADEVDDGS